MRWPHSSFTVSFDWHSLIGQVFYLLELNSYSPESVSKSVPFIHDKIDFRFLTALIGIRHQNYQ